MGIKKPKWRDILLILGVILAALALILPPTLAWDWTLNRLKAIWNIARGQGYFYLTVLKYLFLTSDGRQILLSLLVVVLIVWLILLNKKIRKLLLLRTTKPIEEEEIEEKGIWDFVYLSEKSMQKLKDCVERIAKAMEEIGEKMRKHTQGVLKIQSSNIPGSASQMYNLTKATAYDMNLYAKKTEEEQPKLHLAWNEFVENTAGFIRVVNIKTKEDKKAIIDYNNTIKSLKETNNKCINGIREYRKAVYNLKGISGDVNRASKRIIRILDLLISDFVSANSYCTKIISLLDRKLKKAKNI